MGSCEPTARELGISLLAMTEARSPPRPVQHHKNLSSGDDGGETLSQIARATALTVCAVTKTEETLSRVIPTVEHQIYGRPPMSATIMSFPFLLYLFTVSV